jgi:hypothetical protein
LLNAASKDFRPVPGSLPLYAACAVATASGFEISARLFPPSFHPAAAVQSTGLARPVAGALDIGAYERPVDGVLFTHGFAG